MIVSCNKCNKEFEINLQKRRLENGVIQYYFVCPDCGEEYHAVYSNDEIEAIQVKIDFYADKASKMKNGEKKTETLERMENLIEAKSKKMEELKALMK